MKFIAGDIIITKIGTKGEIVQAKDNVYAIKWISKNEKWPMPVCRYSVTTVDAGCELCEVFNPEDPNSAFRKRKL